MKKLILFFIFFSFPCLAQTVIDSKQVEHIGVFDDWNAYVFNSKKDKVCFVSSMPLKTTGHYNRRGDIYLLISHRPYEHIYDVFTYVAGYTYAPRSEVMVRVGKTKANLFTNKDTAWAKNLKTDEELAKSMHKAVRLTVKGVSIEGIETYDTYSMKGFNDAMEAINRLCRQPL